MKTKITYVGLVIISAIFTSGCTSVGHNVKYSGPASLQLGKTPASVYQATYGKPYLTQATNNAEGDFETSQYVYSYATTSIYGSARARVLKLESRNGVLNAYCYISSFKKDKTVLTVEPFEQIKVGVSTKADVLKVVGEPHGKALCPSYMDDFKDRCAKGIEVWTWVMMEPLSNARAMFGDTRVKILRRLVAFDAKGSVTGVESNDSHR